MTTTPKKRPKPRPKCGICAGQHSALDCTFDGNVEALLQKARASLQGQAECARCGGPIELLGPYCVGCAFDRQIERLLGKTQ